MDVTTNTQVATKERLAHLAELMKQEPAFAAFMRAYDDLQADDEAQKLLTEGQQLRGQLQYAWSQERQTRFNEIFDEFGALPVVQAYNRAELALRELFCAVDAVISETAGVEFAANAKRSGCCGD